MMNIELQQININKKAKLEKSLQLYLHNTSIDFPIDFNNEECTYSYEGLDKYLEGKENKAFLILKDKKVVGFILADITKEKNVIQEMFVLNNFKRQGIGQKAVKLLFDKYNGYWEVKSLPNSKGAETFWITIIKDYTNNNYKLEYIGKYNRAVLRFDNE